MKNKDWLADLIIILSMAVLIVAAIMAKYSS